MGQRGDRVQRAVVIRYRCTIRMPRGDQAQIALATSEVLGQWLAEMPWQRWANSHDGPVEIRIERFEL